MRASLGLCFLISTAIQSTTAIGLDVHDADSIKNAAKTVAYDLISYYSGNYTGGTVGILPSAYYWWESGAMWGALVDYWHYTGDESYNDITYEGLLSQLGPSNDFMLVAQEGDEGNDDQAWWGFAAMSAAEKNFMATPSDTPDWLDIVINVWTSQMERWDTSTCNGGLKWQIYSTNAGYDYKNSVTNGAFFQFSARLAHFTGNQTYLDWAEKAFDWAFDIGLISSDYEVFDGTNDLLNCSQMDHSLWSYSLGIYLYGAAVMYNYTNGSTIWETRTANLLAASATFFTPFDNTTDIMYEPSCELTDSCDNDELSFKAYLSRFMWSTAKIAPFTSNAIHVLLQSSAQAAALACTGGTDGSTCGTKWYLGGSDGTAGVGQQLSALEVIQGLLVNETEPVMHFPNVHFSTITVTNVVSSANEINSTDVTASASNSNLMSNSTDEAPVPSETKYSLASAPGSTRSKAPEMGVRSSFVWLSSLAAIFAVLFI